MRKFKYVGSESEASDYTGDQPIIGKVYNEDDQISGNSVIDWAGDGGVYESEWEEVFEEEGSQQAYYAGEKDYMSLSISTFKDGREVNINFGTNDLEELKKFVNNLIC